MMNSNYYEEEKEEARISFNEDRYMLTDSEKFQHDVKWMLENVDDFCVANVEILKSLKINNDFEEFLQHLRAIDAELESSTLSSNYWDASIEGFIITFTESLGNDWCFYASPIIVLDGDEKFFNDHSLYECGRYRNTFYTSMRVWDDVISSDNWDQLMNVYADPENENLYPGEHLLGMSYYGDLGRIFYRCDEIEAATDSLEEIASKEKGYYKRVYSYRDDPTAIKYFKEDKLKYAQELGHEPTVQETLEHDIMYSLTYIDEYTFLMDYINEIDVIRDNLTIADLGSFIDNEIEPQSELLSFVPVTFCVHSFVLSKDTEGYLASPIVILLWDDDEDDHKIGGHIGRINDVFYISADVWNAIHMAPNYEEILNRIFSSYCYQQYEEEILGIVDYGYLKENSLYLTYKHYDY